MNLPNKLTLFRIALTFIFVALLFVEGLAAKAAALVLFLAASLTDLFDGYIARKYNLITDFGKIMDPVADKILVLSAFLAFIQFDIVPAWMVILIILRESVITGIRIGALTKGTVLAAQEGGKQKTVSQMAAIFLILAFLVIKAAGRTYGVFWDQRSELYCRELIYIVMLITTALTLISGSSFLYKNRAMLKG